MQVVQAIQWLKKWAFSGIRRPDDGENFIPGLLREVSEEIGNIRILDTSNQLIVLTRKETREKITVTFGTVIDCSELKNIRLNASTGGLEFVTRNKIADIKNLATCFKKDELVPADVMAMFPDEIEALNLAFEKLCL